MGSTSLHVIIYIHFINCLLSQTFTHKLNATGFHVQIISKKKKTVLYRVGCFTTQNNSES